MPEIKLSREQFEKLHGRRGLLALSAPVWPTVSSVITQGVREGHVALDLRAPLNSPIRAAFGGEVVSAGWSSVGYGNSVVVREPSGRLARYSHLNAFSVREGDRISAGGLLGLAGSTGNSTASHLDIRFWDATGRRLDPRPILEGGSIRPLPAGINTQAARGSAAPFRAALPATVFGAPDPRAQVVRSLSVPPAQAERTQEAGDIRVLKTPIGDVSIPPMPWPNIAAVAAGVVLFGIGSWWILAPRVRPIAEAAAKLGAKVATRGVAG